MAETRNRIKKVSEHHTIQDLLQMTKLFKTKNDRLENLTIPQLDLIVERFKYRMRVHEVCTPEQ